MGYATVSLYFQSDSKPRWFIVDGDYHSTRPFTRTCAFLLARLIAVSCAAAVSIEFLHWIAETPAESMFNVPRDCTKKNHTADPTVGCLARGTIVRETQCCTHAHRLTLPH
jgi:hypothetical protein